MQLNDRNIEALLADVGLTMDDVMPLLALAQTKSLDVGDIYYRQSDQQPKFAFILSGILRGYYLTSDGKESTYVLRTDYDIIACWEMILLNIPSNHTVEAVTPTQLLSFDFTQVKRVIDDTPKLQQAFTAKIQTLYGQSLLHYQRFVNQKPEERYHQLRLDAPHIIDQLPKKITASYLGVTPGSYSRMVRRLQTQTLEE